MKMRENYLAAKQLWFILSRKSCLRRI